MGTFHILSPGIEDGIGSNPHVRAAAAERHKGSMLRCSGLQCTCAPQTFIERKILLFSDVRIGTSIADESRICFKVFQARVDAFGVGKTGAKQKQVQ